MTPVSESSGSKRLAGILWIRLYLKGVVVVATTYITVRQSPRYHQMSIDEFLSADVVPTVIDFGETNTRTYKVQWVSDRFKDMIDVPELIRALELFNQKPEVEQLRTKPRAELYHTFYIPKRNGKPRRIDAPCEELMEVLRELKKIFEVQFGALYHTSSFAYVKGRNTVSAVKRHQHNESKWFAKFDISGFFPSTSLDFAINQFAMVFPFSEVINEPYGKEMLRDALELAFLNGSLPQGTPISPLITNIMMIPIDFEINQKLRDFDRNRYIETRYADDVLISSKSNFDFRKVEHEVLIKTLTEFNAPFYLNQSKTRYGSSAGSNWNLGVMLNKDNQITVGHKKKRQFQTMLFNYGMDRKNGKKWELEDVQTLQGLYSYYKSVEGQTIDKIVNSVDAKVGINIRETMRADLRA